LLENTSNDSFLRQGFAEGLAEELLLRSPEEVGRSKTPKEPSMNGAKAHGPTAVTPPAAKFRNAPLSDFAREANRAAMASALESIKPQLGQTYTVVIDNRPVQTPGTIDSLNPSHSKQLVGKTGRAMPEVANQACAS